SWLSDDSGVVFSSHRVTGPEMRVASLRDGSERHFATLSMPAGKPTLSRDGRTVAFHSLDANNKANVWTQLVSGSKPFQVTFDKEFAGYPSWSPDGKWLSYEVWRGDDIQLAVVPSGGGEPRDLTSGRGLVWSYSWAPDNDRIACSVMKDGAWNLEWISKSTGERKKLTTHGSFRTFVRDPAWSPAGDQLVFEFAETKGNVFMGEM
ncbi:MAG: hypothetical protein ABIZ80_03125, partial [Bryobacteraceae bacterium]